MATPSRRGPAILAGTSLKLATSSAVLPASVRYRRTSSLKKGAQSAMLSPGLRPASHSRQYAAPTSASSAPKSARARRMAARSRHTPSQICPILSEAVAPIPISRPPSALLFVVGDCEMHESAPDFLDGDARVPAPLLVGFDARRRAAQQLLTP